MVLRCEPGPWALDPGPELYHYASNGDDHTMSFMLDEHFPNCKALPDTLSH